MTAGESGEEMVKVVIIGILGFIIIWYVAPLVIPHVELDPEWNNYNTTETCDQCLQQFVPDGVNCTHDTGSHVCTALKDWCRWNCTEMIDVVTR